MTEAQKNVVSLYNEVRLSTDSYKNFLKTNNIKNKELISFDEFLSLPLTNKKNYLENYPIEERVKGGQSLDNFYMICTSSGSTGEPTIWPRSYEMDNKIIELNRNLYEKLFDIKGKKTLVVVTFGLGAWTAGMLTSRLCWEASPGNKLSVVTPGLDKVVALKVIRSLSPYYDQVIVTGYPPFIVDLIEYGLEEKFDFKKINMKIHYTSARVSEKQRRVLAKNISSTNSVYDILGFYACSETGIIGIETKEIVDILSECYKNKKLCRDLFKDPDPPTLIEYNPNIKFLEELNGHIVVTANQPIPLIRYDMNDRGGLLSSEDIVKIFTKHGIRISLKGEHFAYVHGRADSIRILNNVYIDDIQYCLERSKFSKRFSGHFKYGLENIGLKNRLKVVVYLKKGESFTNKEKELFIDEIYKNLLKVNPDFRMIQQGIKVERFNVEFKQDDPNKYSSGKLKHFL